MKRNRSIKNISKLYRGLGTRPSLKIKTICFLFIFAGVLVFCGIYSQLALAKAVKNVPAGIENSQLTRRSRAMKQDLLDSQRTLPEPGQFTKPGEAPDVGGVDTSFGTSVTQGSPLVNALATQPDGKFLMGGFFSSVNGVTRSCLERFNADGTRDTGFNPGGTGANGTVFVILVLPDGKLMIGGGFTTYNGSLALRIARLNPDGTFDPTFAPQGSSVNGGLQDLVIQPDGKILISGSFSAFNGVARPSIARLNPDGTLDTGFAPGMPNSGFLEQMKLQTDGKIVAVGFSLIRLNSNGSTDTGFNIGAGADGGVYGVELQADGQILICGDFTTFNGTARPGIARINTDGSVDTTFHPLSFGAAYSFEYFAIQPDGKIVVVGLSGSPGAATGLGIIRLYPDGDTDLTFSPGGVDDTGYVVALQPDGKILLGGFFTQYAELERTGVVRLNPNGTPDAFSTSPGVEALVNTVVPQTDGKLLIGGQFRRVNGFARRGIARLNPDGTIDTSFDPGSGTSGLFGFRPFVYSIAVQGDGQILAGGIFTNFNGTVANDIVRLNPTGSVDGSFVYNDAFGTVRDIELRSGGKIVLAGNFFNTFEGVNSGIVKLNSDGSYDQTAVGTGSNSLVTRIIPLTDGSQRAMIVGGFTMYNGTVRRRIARINDDGSLDTTFDPGATSFNSTAYDVSLLPNGQMYVSGAFSSFNGVAGTSRIVRLNSNGTLDSSFSSGATGFNGSVWALLLEPNLQILLGGSFTNNNGSPTNQIALLNTNGSLDNSFTSQLGGGFANDVERIFPQADGKILVGGRFTNIGGAFRNSIARLNAAPGGSCVSIPIGYDQTINGNLNSGSCVLSGPADLYTFSAKAGQQIAIALDSADPAGIHPMLELVDVDGSTVIASNSGAINARIPTSGFFTLPSNGSYTIRVITTALNFGDYSLSLSVQPASGCVYTVSPTSTNVSPSGGTTFFFDVLKGDGCPTVTAATGSSHIHILTNSGGRVTFSVDSYSGTTDRTGTIDAGGQVHTVTQFGVMPPANDLFSQAQVLPGLSGTVSGRNTNATAETGEPPHAGGPASRSVWYRWTAPGDGLYSFTTSGSDFDTLMAIYTGTSVDALTRIAENDDTTSFDQTSKINFRATAGVMYSIAVDGKNGTSGSIQLGYSRYRRLFRLYLQNFNGFPSPITPTSVTAIRQDNTGPTINGVLVSQGVYEFDLPDDNSPYIATIAGPQGIVWQPSTYLIDNTGARFNELMDGAEGGGQNMTSNATNEIPRHFLGFIHGISTQPQLAVLRVQIATTGSASAPPPADCPNPVLVGGGPNGSMRVLYNCITQPNTTSQIVPNAPQTAFQVSVLNLPVLDHDTGPASANAMTAANSPTYNIGGRVLADGVGLSGVPIDVTAGSMSLRVTSDAGGNYSAANLAPGQVYTLRAVLDGFTFQAQTVNLQPPGATVDIPAQTCAYTLAGNGSFDAGGGQGEFTVTATTSQTCGWVASRDSEWFSILSGSSVGNGLVQFSVQPNTGAARQGSISVGGQSFLITQAAGCSFTGTLVGPSNFTAAGGQGTIDIAASNGACVLTPAATDYCMLSVDGSTVGNQPVNFTVSANAGVARSADIYIGGQVIHITQDAGAGEHRTKFDFDGDGKADVSVFRPSSGIWYLYNSSIGVTGMQFGADGDIPVAGDYDGDGKADLAVFRPSDGFWYRINSSNGQFIGFPFGLTGDIPVPGDYDGDGSDDIAVYRPSTGIWYLYPPSGVQAIPFGISEDKPVVGDYDGDGRADIAVFRPSTGIWYMQQSTNGFSGVQFGTMGDVPVPRDYDGDGKTDVAVFRESSLYWYRLNSSNGAFVPLQFGLPGDKPVPADYNGDSFADIAMYRPSTAYWYIWSCTGNVAITSTQFGLETDIPVPYPITP